MTRNEDTKIAVVLHLFYPEMWVNYFKPALKRLSKVSFDLYVTGPALEKAVSDQIYQDYPSATIVRTVNLGRDVLPFLGVARSLDRMGYQSVLKLHSKRSPQRIDGSEWLDSMVSKLLPNNERAMADLIQTIQKSNTGIIGPASHYLALPVGEVSMRENFKNVHDLIALLDSEAVALELDSSWWEYGFFEGTMFWVRLEAIRPILEKGFSIEAFDTEQGQTDGTVAHAIERVLCLYPELHGHDVYESSEKLVKKINYKTDVVPVWSEFYKGERKKVTRD